MKSVSLGTNATIVCACNMVEDNRHHIDYECCYYAYSLLFENIYYQIHVVSNCLRTTVIMPTYTLLFEDNHKHMVYKYTFVWGQSFPCPRLILYLNTIVGPNHTFCTCWFPLWFYILILMTWNEWIVYLCRSCRRSFNWSSSGCPLSVGSVGCPALWSSRSWSWRVVAYAYILYSGDYLLVHELESSFSYMRYMLHIVLYFRWFPNIGDKTYRIHLQYIIHYFMQRVTVETQIQIQINTNMV